MQLELGLESPQGEACTPAQFAKMLVAKAHHIHERFGRPWWEGEFWTARQRQAKRLHEVSYRACFKPQLPHFFIAHLTRPGARVHDPFAGRGTTLIEAALMGRCVSGGDINPLSRILTEPRLWPPTLAEVRDRLERIPWHGPQKAEMDLSMFFHPDTLREILALLRWLNTRREEGVEDHVDRWIRMVATNRLTGHSDGFFSVYTLPPNQAVSPEEQRRINARRGQTPTYRNVPARILRKTRALLAGLSARDVQNLRMAHANLMFAEADAADPRFPPAASVDLTVTSPPFLDVVDYVRDNWLRCWFNGLDAEAVARRITQTPSLQAWREKMRAVLANIYRATRPGGWLAFEVGEVKGGRIALDEHVTELCLQAGWELVGCLVQRQRFTKTSHIWGVSNMRKGTNTQRIVICRRRL